MGLSIVHRVTGAGLAVGLVLLAWWLVALAAGPESFAAVQGAMDGFWGGLVLFGFTLALFYHALNGVRHLVWDLGFGLEKEAAYRSGVVVAAAAVGLSLLTWLVVLVSS